MFKVGDKVVPHSKSLIGKLEDCYYWKKAKEKGQPYLFVNRRVHERLFGAGEYNVCGDILGIDGNYYADGDLALYAEKPATLTTGQIKAYELMKLAAENPQKYEGKRYKVVDGSPLENGSLVFYECVICKGSFKSPSKSLYLAAFDDAQLEEIPQPVPFMEAVKAFSEGKTIICTHKNHAHKYKGKGTPLYSALNDEMSTAPDAHEILEGVWTVEG